MIDDAAGIELIEELRGDLDRAGLTGSFLVRDLATGAEIGIDPEGMHPLASLVKVPLALVALAAMASGELDEGTRLQINPGRISTRGPTGLTRFRHPVDLAAVDALALAVSISDNVAADAIFELISPAQVTHQLEVWGITGIVVRHDCAGMTRTPAETLAEEDVDLAHSMAIAEGTAGGGHRVPQLDVTRTNVGTARALVDLLDRAWAALPDTSCRRRTPAGRVPDSAGPIPETAARTLRELMAANVHRQRLAPDFAADASRWSSKTGTLLNRRHEIGVVEHGDGAAYAIAALTASQVAASTQPAAEAVMADVARRLRDHLR